MFESFSQLHTYVFDADRIPVLIAAILITGVVGMITGPLRGNAYPFFWQIIDALFGSIGDKMDRPHRKKSDLVFRGFLLTAFVLFLCLLMGKSLEHLFFLKSDLYEIITVSLFLSSGTIWFSLLQLYFALDKQGRSSGAFLNIARTTRTNLNSVDDFGITRSAMGLSAISLDKALVAPSLWYLIGGLPLLIIYSALSALAWRLGKKGLGSSFSAVPLALEKLMGVVPSYFTGFLLVASSSLTPTAKLLDGLKILWDKKNDTPYEQGGNPLKAMSWSLKVTLGGPVQTLKGEKLPCEWVGPEGATAQLSHKNLGRAIWINVIAHIVFILILLCAYIYAGKIF
ncbi:MAG: cobalamin biosynthesis protein [Alphaproteobacteria bacterium]|nr:cobalamin biosynthesis protein [Alphaproteobacteria bacterium]